jgi:glutamate racemase
MGNNVKLIDSGVAAANVIINELNKLDLRSTSNLPGTLDLYVSDIPTKFQEVAELFLGKKINNAVKVELEELLNFSQI